jgi:hypothetical protein
MDRSTRSCCTSSHSRPAVSSLFDGSCCPERCPIRYKTGRLGQLCSRRAIQAAPRTATRCVGTPARNPSTFKFPPRDASSNEVFPDGPRGRRAARTSSPGSRGGSGLADRGTGWSPSGSGLPLSAWASRSGSTNSCCEDGSSGRTGSCRIDMVPSLSSWRRESTEVDPLPARPRSCSGATRP